MQFNFYCRKYIILLFVVFVHQLQSQSIKKVLDKLPDTGQSKSYTDTLGEDSDYTINAPELIDNLYGTITDKITGTKMIKKEIISIVVAASPFFHFFTSTKRSIKGLNRTYKMIAPRNPSKNIESVL